MSPLTLQDLKLFELSQTKRIEFLEENAKKMLIKYRVKSLEIRYSEFVGKRSLARQNIRLGNSIARKDIGSFGHLRKVNCLLVSLKFQELQTEQPMGNCNRRFQDSIVPSKEPKILLNQFSSTSSNKTNWNETIEALTKEKAQVSLKQLDQRYSFFSGLYLDS